MEKFHKFINTLQAQPVQIRKIILGVVSTLIMIVVILVWANTFSSSVGASVIQNSKVPNEKPFSLISSIIKDSYASALNGFKSTK